MKSAGRETHLAGPATSLTTADEQPHAETGETKTLDVKREWKIEESHPQAGYPVLGSQTGPAVAKKSIEHRETQFEQQTDADDYHYNSDGTPVATEFGHKRIEDIVADDLVWACDLTTGQWELCEVVETYVTDYVGESIRLQVEDDWIESTRHHPFWVVAGADLENRPRPDHVKAAEVANATVPGRWVDAGDLLVGDRLLLRDGRQVPIAAIEVQLVVDPVYNFQVAGLHNYAVGLVDVLVHNNARCYFGPRTPGAYLRSGRNVFPTRANSGLVGDALRNEQREFFLRGLQAGKDAAELRGQAAAAGYTRRGGWFSNNDRLADRGAENALQDALRLFGR